MKVSGGESTKPATKAVDEALLGGVHLALAEVGMAQ
jgi:hypothetical protein